MIGKRVHLTPSEDTREKLIRLALTCRKHPTTMANELITLCLNNPNIIDFVQRTHNVDSKSRIRTRIEGERLIYE